MFSRSSNTKLTTLALRRSRGLQTAEDSAREGNRHNDFRFFELDSAEVIDVILDSKHKDYNSFEDIGRIKVRGVNSDKSSPDSDLPFAKPLNVNVTKYPLIGEIVVIGSFSDKTTTANSGAEDIYYLDTINIWGSKNHNALPFASFKEEKSTQGNVSTYNESVGNPLVNSGTEVELGNTFKEKDNIRPVQPYEGDIIYESRFGQSIRFGSTVKGAGIPNKWSNAGKNGDPIIIIKNGQSSTVTKGNNHIVEDINEDPASIYLTSGQEISLKPANNNQRSFKGSEPKRLIGDQIIGSANRIILNARRDEILLFSKKAVGISTAGPLNIDTSKKTTINSPQIDLGLNAGEALILGDTFNSILGEFLNALTSNAATFVATSSGPGVLSPAVVAAATKLTTTMRTALSTDNKTN